MNINKTFYYLKSLHTLIRNSKNVGSLLMALFHKNNTLFLKNGLQFKYRSLLDTLIIKETIYDDFYQLHKIINPKIIVDVGAGFGDFSLFAAHAFPDATIYAFEPNPTLFELLQGNIKSNGIRNIVAFSNAISNKKNITLNFSSEPTQSSSSTKVSSDYKIRVKGVSISSMLKKKNIDFLKIDCEGGEWDIIRFLSDTEKKNIDVISLEYHNMYVENVDEKIKKKLSSHFNVTIKPDSFTSDYGHLFAKNKD